MCRDTEEQSERSSDVVNGSCTENHKRVENGEASDSATSTSSIETPTEVPIVQKTPKSWIDMMEEDWSDQAQSSSSSMWSDASDDSSKSSTAWKPKRVTGYENADTEVYDKFMSILNKLTPERFGALLSQVRALKIDSEARLSHITSLVLDKAMDEAHFASMYAHLCNTLLQRKILVDAKTGKQADFHQILLRQCQTIFDETVKDAKVKEDKLKKERKSQLAVCESKEERDMMREVFSVEDQKLKRRSLGFLHFIGELYNVGILGYDLIHACLLKLLKSDEDPGSIERACELFKTVGRKVESNSKSKDPGTEKIRTTFTMHLNRLKKIIEKNAKKPAKAQLPKRVIFAMRNVHELKNRDWIPRIKTQAPKTLAQIQRDADNERILASASSFTRRADSPRQRVAYNKNLPHGDDKACYNAKNERKTYELAREAFQQIEMSRLKFLPIFDAPRQ